MTLQIKQSRPTCTQLMTCKKWLSFRRCLIDVSFTS
jgi:hypothetical protein